MTDTLLYRATDRGETGIPVWSCWAEDEAVARAYQAVPGLGYGGPCLRTIPLHGPVLDIADDGFRSLAVALGYDDPEETAQLWRDAGWLYPWEESGAVADRLTESEYYWLRYTDDYPEGAVTYVRVGLIDAGA